MSTSPRQEGKRGFFAAVPRNVRRLVYISSPTMVGVGYMTMLVTAYFPEIGVDPGSVGVILGAMGLAMVVSAIPLGMLSDRVERKRVLLPPSLVFPFCLLAFALTTNELVLVVAGIVAGIAEGAFLASWNALIADQTTRENRDSAFALSFVVSTVMNGLGLALPLAFPLVEHATGWSSHVVHTGTMAVIALVSFLTPAGLWLLLKDYREAPRPRRAFRRVGDLRPLLRFSGLNGLVGLGAGFIIPLIPMWLLFRWEIEDNISGPILALAGLTIGFAAVGSTVLSRRFGQVRAIVMTQGLSTVFMLSIVAMPTAFLAGAVYVVRAALMNMASPLLDSFLMGIVSPEQRGFASAVNSLIWRLPNSVTTVVGAYILRSGDYNLPFYLAAGFYIVAITGFFFVFKDVKPHT